MEENRLALSSSFIVPRSSFIALLPFSLIFPPSRASLRIMPIVGHGIDIVETARIRKLVEEHGQRFLDRCFTAMEQAYCNRNPKRYYEHLSGRFAAKEAVLKVLGTGWRGKIAWTDMEILNEPSGKPVLTLSGECERLAGEFGIARWMISISHIETHAIASAIGLRPAKST
jgi:holo-[acyl-carrier protein] synthase